LDLGPIDRTNTVSHSDIRRSGRSHCAACRAAESQAALEAPRPSGHDVEAIGAQAAATNCRTDAEDNSFLPQNTKEDIPVINFIVWLVVGGVIGWLASIVMRTDAQQGILLNIVVGIVGAMIGGWLLSPLFGAGSINQSNFSLMGLLVSFLGALILLGVVNLVRRGAVR
jgi:uncharacterized membrane protein YeaQ/YmgE (transglycosylase-associated protein family)